MRPVVPFSKMLCGVVLRHPLLNLHRPPLLNLHRPPLLHRPQKLKAALMEWQSQRRLVTLRVEELGMHARRMRGPRITIPSTSTLKLATTTQGTTWQALRPERFWENRTLRNGRRQRLNLKLKILTI